MSAIDYQIDMFFSRMASLRFETSEENGWRKKYAERRGKYPKWTTRDGRQISICDMDDNHLTNTIEMLRRSGKGGQWLKILRMEKRWRNGKSDEEELRFMEEVAENVF